MRCATSRAFTFTATESTALVGDVGLLQKLEEYYINKDTVA